MIRKRISAVVFAAGLTIGLIFLAACRSAFIEATLRNDGDSPIRVQTLNAHAVYHYRFKVQGSGPVTLSYTGPDGHTHTATGPTLDEGQHGTLTISVDPAGKIGWGESLIRTK
jgi:hypothetical protein